MAACGVSWCLAVAVDDSQVCSVHARWPVLHGLESHAQWMRRVRGEQIAAVRREKSEAFKRAAAEKAERLKLATYGR